MTTLASCALGILALVATAVAFAAGQSSANFVMQRDAINAGVTDMSSINFRLSSSVGDAVGAGTITSVSFQLAGGFRGQVITPIVVPSAPTLNSITSGPGSATLNFAPPTNNGGSAISSYTATCTASGQVTRTASGSGSPLTVVGLTGGVAYQCSITATNGGGLTSSASGFLPVTPAPANKGITPLLMYFLD